MMEMIMKGKSQILVLFFAACYSMSLLDKLHGQAELRQAEFHVGVIVDMGTREGKILESCISMAISDFYSLQREQQVRIALHTRDSKGDPLQALSAAFDLLGNAKVGVILGAQASILEAKFLAELGDKARVPIFSFTAFGSSPISLHNYPYFFQIAQDETAEFKGVVAVIERHSWERVIIINEDDDNYDWMDLFENRRIHIAYRSAMATSSKDDQIIEELRKLKATETKIFVVHVSHRVASRIFLNAKRLGMISEGYAWIVTSKSMNLLIFKDSSISESMQGVLGFRSYIMESEELLNFTSRLRKELYNTEPHKPEMKHLSLNGVWAYDVACSLTKAASKVVPTVSQISQPDGRILNSMDFDNLRSYIHSSILLQEIFQNKFKGLSGEFQFVNGKLVISSTFEIVNVVGDRQIRRVGFWSSAAKFSKKLHGFNHGRHLSSLHDLETLTWPGGTSSKPKGQMMQMTSGKILRIAVPVKPGFTELVKVERNPRTNASIVTGFCIDVFKAAVDGLTYDLQYEFIPYGNGHVQPIYNDLVHQVYLQKYDAVVGDVAITANRSLYVDFTLPFTDLGVGIIVPKEKTNMWIFLKPLRREFWLTSVGIYLLTASVIWLIERPARVEQSTDQSDQRTGRIFWFSFSVLVFAHWEQLSSNLSKTVFLVWVFVVFILSSSYTATLTSMVTVEQIESKGSAIGHQQGPVSEEITTGNLKLESRKSVLRSSPEDYAEALSKGAKNGGVSAIIDELPYIKIFLAKYSADFSMIGSTPTTNGFGFVFAKGSPALVRDISREIAKLREDGRLQRMENEWFKSPMNFHSEDDPSKNNVNPLTLRKFGGLFLISGAVSTIAFLLYFARVLYRNWHIVRNWRQLESVKRHVSMTISKRMTRSNVGDPELNNS